MTYCRRKGGSSAIGLGGRSESMAGKVQYGVCVIFVLVLARISNVGSVSASITLPVIRSFSQMEGSGVKGPRGMTLEHAAQLKDHDFVRHQRLLVSVADFPLGGNEYSIGLYYTEIGLGTPADSYFVQVDTGSDLLWVNCASCDECPDKSTLSIDLRLYDPSKSSTSSNTSCVSTICTSFLPSGNGDSCVDNSCHYRLQYGDGSGSMGYLVSDSLTYSIVASNNSFQDVSSKIVFGCGFNQSGNSLTGSQNAVDGIMGFGKDSHSVVSQLAEGGFTTNEFAHCLQGDTGEGGIFVIGDVQEPGIAFTPLIQKTSHYNVDLQSMSVGSTKLNIPSSAFATGDGNEGTIFDSGTTLALFADEAYDAFVTQLRKVQTANEVSVPGQVCFQVSESALMSSFPNATLAFDGASMELDPTNYLMELQRSVWCLAWTKSSDSDLTGTTIIGDIILKNRLVVYDLENQRLGWKDYDCLSSVKVASGTNAAGQVVTSENVGSGCAGSLLSLSTHPISVLICSMVLAYVVAFF